ncbi:hypothetical protein D5018_01880 [Parashewanella curva]|uniref:Uncharacterized protein n=1 Tax=Parashewanella curva TaxID=2338552 RepID=A0A3L8Q1K7_9GAMM|nr:hypothetical protein [Parashewanella curva]RLV61464.1 hypothetical protein D5018_01880 [Parashewanella curva]
MAVSGVHTVSEVWVDTSLKTNKVRIAEIKSKLSINEWKNLVSLVQLVTTTDPVTQEKKLACSIVNPKHFTYVLSLEERMENKLYSNATQFGLLIKLSETEYKPTNFMVESLLLFEKEQNFEPDNFGTKEHGGLRKVEPNGAITYSTNHGTLDLPNEGSLSSS